VNKGALAPAPAKGAPRAPAPGHGLLPYLKRTLPGAAVVDAYYKEGITAADVAVFLSPEFNIDYVVEFLARAKPRMAVMFIHEPGMDIK
jgi:hypothetical protein